MDGKSRMLGFDRKEEGVSRELRVRDLMSREVIAVGPEDTLATLRDLMYQHQIRHVPVVDHEGKLVGLVTHRDLLRSSLVEQTQLPSFVERAVLEQTEVVDLMTTDLATVHPETDIREAAQLMFDNKFGCLPVLEDGRPVGILTEADFVKLMAGGN